MNTEPTQNFDQLEAAMRAAANPLPITWNTPNYTRDGDFFYNGWKTTLPSGLVYFHAHFGNWQNRDLDTHWKSDVGLLGSEDRAALDEYLIRIEAEKKAAEEETHRQAAVRAEYIWGLASDIPHEYYTRKKIPQRHGTGVLHQSGKHGKSILVPLYDVELKLHTLQFIGEDGQKRLLGGGKKRGSFHALVELDPKKPLYVCEGFATAAAVQEAVGDQGVAICAVDCGNLLPVGAALREKWPEARIVFCGDDDVHKGNQNAGRTKAMEAAAAVKGEVRFPVFTQESLSKKATDFNDLLVLEGVDAVRESLARDSKVVVLPGTRPAKQAKPKKEKIPDKIFTDRLHRIYEGKIYRYDTPKDTFIFKFVGTHWEEQNKAGIDRLKNELNKLRGNEADANEVNRLWGTFVREIPSFPEGVEIYQPQRDRANFQNGTLHIRYWKKKPEEITADPGRGPNHYSMEFKPHDPMDFCTSVLPMEYRPGDQLAENEDLQKCLRNVWPGEDQQKKIELYEEMLGACLAPMFPMVTFLIGQPKTGKSTLVLLSARLVGKKNSSRVDPTTWGKRFGMSSMLHKLVNFNTEVCTTRPLPDELVKQVIDGEVEIERKNLDAVPTFLPAVHFFGANKMPDSLEAISGVYARRLLIIRTDTVQPGQGGGGPYADWLWARGPEGVLKAALRGLERLLANGGRYTVPESSREEMREWETGNDPVAQFIEACEAREIASPTNGNQIILVKPGAEMSSAELYEAFKAHVMKTNPASRVLDVRSFSKRLRQDSRFASKRTTLVRLTTGIGCFGSEEY